MYYLSGIVIVSQYNYFAIPVPSPRWPNKILDLISVQLFDTDGIPQGIFLKKNQQMTKKHTKITQNAKLIFGAKR